MQSVQRVNIAPGAGKSRRELAPRAPQARTRLAQGPTRVSRVWRDAKLARIRATALRAQGLWSAQNAQRLQDTIAQRHRPTVAPRQGLPAHSDTSVSALTGTNRCALLKQECTVR